MKYFGSVFECEQERNEDLMRAYHEQIIACDIIRMPDIFKRLVNMPSKRFWVSEDRAYIVILDLLKGKSLDNMIPTRKEMYQEIFRRFQIHKSNEPYLSNMDIIKRAAKIFDEVIIAVAKSERKAPKFSHEKRVLFAQVATKEITGVRVLGFDTILVD